jgi:NADPH:quinone reductase-like Zn-dependent oxidoreductase
MRAIVYERYGSPSVLEFREVLTPVPESNEVLIRVHATTVSSADWRARSLAMPPGFSFMARLVFGVTRPRHPILGTEFAGVIERIGSDVTKFRVGDAVFAYTGARMGAHAEYVCMREDGHLAPKPTNLTFEQAAALCFGGVVVLGFFRRGRLKRGDRLLVNGASGCVGTAAVQIGVHMGAVVTGVCRGPNVSLVKSLGATDVVDYTRDDFTANNRQYDAIIDTVGTAGYARSRASLASHGTLLLVYSGLGDLLRSPFISLLTSTRVVAGPAPVPASDVRQVAELAAAGHFTPVIDRTYAFEQIIDAHKYVDQGHKRGSVAITVVS